MTKAKKKVFTDCHGIASMFVNRYSGDWCITNELNDCDVLVLRGGPDVPPYCYNHEKHSNTFSSDMHTDAQLALIHRLDTAAPIVGICGGGQLINCVLGDGTMIQDVTGHAVAGGHIAQDLVWGTQGRVTSTHHQMMEPGPDGELLMTANENPNKRDWWDVKQEKFVYKDTKGSDREVIYYKRMKALCFQPHPEYCKNGDWCQEIFFDYLKHCFDL